MSLAMTDNQIDLGQRHRLFVVIIKSIFVLVIFLTMISGVRAENLISVKEEQVKYFPDGVKISKVWVYRDSLVALGPNKLWVLDHINGEWEKRDFVFQGTIKSVVNNDNNTYFLTTDRLTEFINKVEPFVLSGEFKRKEIPLLPNPLHSASGSIMGDQLFILGVTPQGISKMFALDMSEDTYVWEDYSAWEGHGDIVTSVVSQTEKLHVTLKNTTSKTQKMLQWSPKSGWEERGSVPGSIVSGTARPIGQGHVLYLVTSPDKTSAKMMTYSTITGSWAELDRWDNHSILTGTGWKKGILWVESPNSNRGSKLHFVELQTRLNFLTPTDWVVLVAYLVTTLGIGLHSYLHNAQSSESNFFLGGKTIPFWAAGVSLYASNASSISYIAVTAKSFATNWQYLMSNIIVVFGLLFVAVYIVPLLRKLNLTSTFDYLETRFHPSIRLISSVLFIVFQLGARLTVILYLPSLALSIVTGINITLCIVAMGFVTICYTVLGGMKAVVWTDFLQFFVMFGGIIFALIFIIISLDGGLTQFLSSAVEDNKFKMVDLSFNLTDATVWGFLFLVLFDTVLTFPKDQVLMQRVFSTSSAKQAGRSMVTFSAIIIPASIMFFLMGTALYVFYKAHPERMDPSLSLDATFPLFISAELPVGITGLIIAGIFAAAMSTLSSILNSVATVSTVDIYKKWLKPKTEKQNVRIAEIVTVVAGLVGIGLALLLSRYNADSLLDVALELWGLLGGGFAGAYTLGMFTNRANWQGVIVGVVVSIVVTFLFWSIDFVHSYFYMPLSVFICIVVGYAASLLFPPVEHIDGLTIFSDKVTSQEQGINR